MTTALEAPPVHDGYHERRLGRHPMRPESLMMRYGYRPDGSMGAIKSPIFQTSTFAFRTAEEGKAFFEVAYGLRERGDGEEPGLIYSRINNPDLEILEDRLKLWDGAAAAVGFQSGMAAIATTLLTFLRPGDVVLHSEPLYGGTDWLLNHVLTGFGITPVGFPAGTDAAVVEAAAARARGRGRPAMIFVETPANPTQALVDIELCVRLARAAGDDVRVVVDNTFLGPLWQHPLELGADLVLYSLTKYAGGHSDLIAGACLGSTELVSRIRETRTFLGTMMDPWTGWLLLRSLETLKLRMTCQMENARRVADFLAGHPVVERVHYPGRLDADDPQREVYDRQCLGPGGMISFDVRGGEAGAFRFLNALEMVYLAVSLGGTESLAEHPATMTHADIPPDERRRMGIGPGLVRLSVGVEHPDDIVADLERALAAV